MSQKTIKVNKLAEGKLPSSVKKTQTKAPIQSGKARAYIAKSSLQKVAEPALELYNKPAHLTVKRSSLIFATVDSQPEWAMTNIEKMRVVEMGLTKENLETLKSKTKLDYSRLSKILDTTKATLINKRGTAAYSSALSERMVSLADIYSYGFEVFESEAKFQAWLERPNSALNDQLPLDLLNSQYGRNEVKTILGRIEYGVYS